VLATFRPRGKLFQIVSNPVRIKTESDARRIFYPMQLTGSSKGADDKWTDTRLYILTRYRLATWPAFLAPRCEGVVELELGDWFLTVLEGTAHRKDMTEDIVIELDRERPFYDF